jgi:NAD(P)H-flavin reductase
MSVKKMIGKVIYKENLSGSTWLLGISLDETAEFLPGQFVSLKVNNEGLRRSYSIASLPGKKNIELVVDVAPNGVGSKYILGLKVEDTVEVLGFLGKFVVGEEIFTSQKQLLFVGTGTGIVPLKTMVEDLLINKGLSNQISLIWGMRLETDLYWLSELDKLQREYDNFHLEIALSKPGEKWPGVSGHVGDVIEKIKINGKETMAFLCGNPEMISEIKDKLINIGLPETQILYERYA